MQARRMCFDRILPGQPASARRLVQLPDGRTRAISPIGKQWINGSTLRVSFLAGTLAQKEMVTSVAAEWTKYANIKLSFGSDPRAEIRVTFDPSDGAWSYIGTDATGIPLNSATLNLGWLDNGVILHEFGHAMGLAHEHQNPQGGLVWNEANVIKDLTGPPNFWDEQMIRDNVLDFYKVDQIYGTAFDPLSIMLYAFPDDWTVNPGGTSANMGLSAMDRQFIGSIKMYPGAGGPVTPGSDLPVWTSTRGAISTPGEEDLYKFTIVDRGSYSIETTGVNDMIMTLFGPNSQTKKIAEDDDSGIGNNPRITANLAPGTYYAKVKHFMTSAMGPYGIRVIGGLV